MAASLYAIKNGERVLLRTFGPLAYGYSNMIDLTNLTFTEYEVVITEPTKGYFCVSGARASSGNSIAPVAPEERRTNPLDPFGLFG